MRKHDVRKWLHAILDLLPVILIPVFMIYSHRHDVTERTQVDVQYKYQSNEVNSVDDLVEGNIYYLDELSIYMQAIHDYASEDFNLFVLKTLNVNLKNSNDENLPINGTFDEFFFSDYDSNDKNYLYIYSDSYLVSLQATNDNGYIWINVEDNDVSHIHFENVVFIASASFINIISNLVTYDLPQQTDYNVIESVEINDTKSSVMSVFMDDFNNSIDKYFNMGNVFNLNGVYDWFNTNIFSGHAPTIIYSIWNIALYELVMDLLFLLYGLFMWFIDIVENIMNKPFKSIK